MSTAKSNPGSNGSSAYEGIKVRSGVGALRFGQIGGDAVSTAIDAVVDRGDAILFGRTSDGGAFSVRVLSNGATAIWYPTDASELLELLTAVTELQLT